MSLKDGKNLRRMDSLSPAERQAWKEKAMGKNVDPFWKKVWSVMADSACSWAEALARVEDQERGS